MKIIESRARTMHHGFTLPELVAIIVIVAILAAVAIPNFSGFSDDAKKSKASAIFGSLKASYAVQLAIKKQGAVSVDNIVAGHDPSCFNSGTTASCDTKTCDCGNATVVFSGTATDVTAPAGWTCTVSDVGGTTCP